MILQVERLAKTYPGGVEAVRDVSFAAGEGELIALVGESGCGKTTTLKMINRLLEPSAGQVVIEGENARAIDPVDLRRRVGWVMQSDGLFPHFTVAENIGITPSLLGWDRDRIAARVDALLELVRLDPDEYRERRPRRLSGGQRQRVGLARALAVSPRLVLMDEPFGALDPLTRAALRDDVGELRGRLGFAAVMVTHDMAEALQLADRIAVIEAGRILQYDTPRALLAAPADDTVARLVAAPLKDAEAVNRLKERGRDA